MAVICTVAGDGRSGGAVYTPADVIVPTVALPPGTVLTLQLTAVSVVFVTAAVNVSWFPSTTDPVAGVTVTPIDGGAGGGGRRVVPAPQPRLPPPSTRSAITTLLLV